MQYIAFLRGINSGSNPTTKMEELRTVFEALSYEHVRSVLASGNVLFETDATDETSLIRRLEKELSTALGFRIPVVLRTKDELERLRAANPFGKVEVGPETRPHVTFLKERPSRRRRLPRGTGYEVLKIVDRAVCSVVDLSGATTPDLMRVLDKEFGSEVTTRSWNTVERVLRAVT